MTPKPLAILIESAYQNMLNKEVIIDEPKMVIRKPFPIGLVDPVWSWTLCETDKVSKPQYFESFWLWLNSKTLA